MCQMSMETFFVHFMHLHGPSQLFHWPNKDDMCWIGESDIICVIDAPSLASSQRTIKKIMIELYDSGRSG